MTAKTYFPLETIVSRAKRKGFVYPNSDIYGGLANARDFGPYGAKLKKNIQDLWVNHFTQLRDDVVYMDTAIIAHPTTWVASGHVGGFADALIDDKKTGQRFRADKIIEARIESMKQDIAGSIEKGDMVTLDKIIMTSHEPFATDIASGYTDALAERMIMAAIGRPNLSPEARGNDGMHEFITKFIPNNPDTRKPAERTECRNFNLMLDTHLGPVADDANKVYMRPETCQSLFTDFRAVLDSTRNRIPFGLAQVGKAFRNEITPGQFLFRTREFEQMEIEYFVPANPEAAAKIYDQWKADSRAYWTEVLRIPADRLRFKDHDKLAHYAASATDIEYMFPRGYGEVQGVHNRTNFDLTQHQETSNKDMQYKDPFTGERYIPRCIEASRGLGRQVMVSLLEFYDEEEVKEGDTRVVVRFPFALAPVKCAVFPLMEKDENMARIAKEIAADLRKKGYTVEYDGSGNIGKRYRRQDEIGTPYCITVDHTTLENGMVTIRDRDTMEQVSVARDAIEFNHA